MLTNNAVYVEGRKSAEPDSLRSTYEIIRRNHAGVAWIGLYKPTDREFASVAEEFGLHELAVEDAIKAHQRPKLERYGDTLFVVLRPARYVDAEEDVKFSEIHIFVGENFVVTVRHGESPDTADLKQRLEERPDLLVHGPEAILYALLDQVVDRYRPVVEGLENDIDEIEAEVFSGNPNASRRIYELSREVIEFQRATKPLVGMLDGLTAGFEKYGIDQELQRYLRDVQDHVLQVVEQVEGFRQILQNILSVNLTLVSVQQNEEVKGLTEVSIKQNDEVKKISAWAAILFAPTAIAGVYGMNFDDMPELHWSLGYPFALGLMFLVCMTLFFIFKNRGWL
ncbi:magnesium/cobalt transporter CorA [Rubrobacter indicoceani]|uniref:magnesium/cobalt transporter CorA n=1 Tax=Rubrobacter indicoceani TaxID=2051957 RepID=UPI001968F602|nr:magnesium/cobalt transporter CorA [Rubrobacter indicoceani]